MALEWLVAPDGRAFFFGAAGVGLLSILGAAISIAASRQRSAISHQPSAVGHCASCWKIVAGFFPLLLPAVDVLSGSFQPWRGPVLLLGGLGMTLLCVVPCGLSRRAGFVIAVALPLLIYLPDLSPYVGRADTFEFQIVAPRLGIAHPSGYPLYILIGKLFSLLPFGTGAWRVNLSSAVCAALASGALFLALSERAHERMANGEWQTTKLASPIQNPVALLAALTLAFSPTLWSRAIEAEVYALNALLTASALWIVTRWATGKLQAQQALPFMGLLTGLAVASHITLGALVFLALPLLVARPRPTWRALLGAVGLGLAGLALYAYIPLRWPAVNNGEVMTFDHFLRFVTNAESGGALHLLAFIQDPARWTLVFRLLRMQVGWVGLALAAVGLGRLFLNGSALWKSRLRMLGAGTLVAFGAWVWFNLSFYVADPDYSAFLIPAHVILIYWLGAASSEWRVKNERIGESANKRITFHASRITFHVLVTLLALLPLSRLWITGPGLDTITEGRADEAWGQYTLQQPLAANAAILADSEKFPPLYYLQHMEGLRPDLELVMLFDEAQYRAALESRLAQGQPVYLARYLPGLDVYGVSAAGPLVEVAPSSPAVRTETPLAHFGDALALCSFRLEADPAGRALHHLTLVWQTEAPVSDDVEIRIRLTSAEQVIWERAATRPVSGYTTTQAWPPGAVIADYHALHWPAWLAPGDYTVEVGVFPRFAQTGLPVDGTAAMWHPLARVSLLADVNRPLSQRTHALFDGALWLAGADVPGEGYASGPITIDLTWQRGNRAPQALPEIRWIDAAGHSAQTAASPSINGSPATWSPGERRTVRYTVVAPPEPGRYMLVVSGQPSAVSQNMARCGWMERLREACALGEVNVLPSNVGLANFGNQVVLLDATLDASAVPAGGQLQVELRWRGLRAWEHDYTVFVQVVGPDSQLYGQADSWPVQGARPTSGWAAGEEVADPYRLYLKENAPPGEYTVIVGWYLLADMSRLPLVDANGQTIGDYYAVGHFTVGE